MSLAVLGFLGSVWLLAVLFGAGLQGTSADTAPGAGSASLAHLQHAYPALAAADDAIEANETEMARLHVQTARAHLDAAETTLARERPQLASTTVDGLERAIELGRHTAQLQADELAWRGQLPGLRASLDAAPNASERANALAEAADGADAGEHVAAGHERLRDDLRAFLRDHPGLATALEPDENDLAAPERLDENVTTWSQGVEAGTVDAAFSRTDEDQQKAMREAAAERLDAYNPQRLRVLFESFDANDNGTLDPNETLAFYDWVEHNVAYRHDDENATAEIPGTPVGDGRPGTDYQQSPLETYDERLGDCEDTSTLQVAFHQYWGRAAYQALVNTDPGEGIDHAVAIVRFQAPLQVFEEPEAGFHTYTFGEKNEHDVEPGTYLVVDNTYSDAFGTISGGVEEGTFEILDVETLAQSLQRSDDWRGPAR